MAVREPPGHRHRQATRRLRSLGRWPPRADLRPPRRSFRDPRAAQLRQRGRTWGDEIVLRNEGGCWDLGYTRSVQRPDGQGGDGSLLQRFRAATSNAQNRRHHRRVPGPQGQGRRTRRSSCISPVIAFRRILHRRDQTLLVGEPHLWHGDADRRDRPPVLVESRSA